MRGWRIRACLTRHLDAGTLTDEAAFAGLMVSGPAPPEQSPPPEGGGRHAGGRDSAHSSNFSIRGRANAMRTESSPNRRLN